MIIKPTSLTITQLLGSQNEQYVVPAYQRRYSWHEKQLWELLDDISLLDNSDTHLLGSIVCLTGPHTAGINKLELVDGQQRITTISMLLHCIMDHFALAKQTEEAQDIARLLHAKALGSAAVRKIALDSLDAAEFDQLAAGTPIDRPANANLASAFSLFRTWVNEKTTADLAQFVYRLKNQAIVIRLDVSEAKDAFKLFETINNRGLKLSPPDIIKNFILGNAARFSPQSLTLARKSWAELIRNLDGTSFESFFRHFLCATLKRRITISYVITHFKTLFMQQVAEAARLPERHWYTEDDSSEEDREEASETSEELETPFVPKVPRMSFAKFLKHLVACADTYGKIAHASTGHPQIDRHLRNLRMIKSLQTYGFLMALRIGGCSDKLLIKVLRLTEAFLLRRHICRERSNETDTAFARLCGVDCANPLKEITKEFRRLCPSDEKFREEFAGSEYTTNLIDRARYCLEQLEVTKHGTHLELLVGGPDLVHVEHIIPIKIKTKKAVETYGDWPTYLGSGSETKHPHFVGRIGNLTLFAGALNIGASNNPYARKKAAYLKSAIELTKTLPSEFPEFRFKDVEKRCAEFAKLAVTLWPIP